MEILTQEQFDAVIGYNSDNCKFFAFKAKSKKSREAVAYACTNDGQIWIQTIDMDNPTIPPYYRRQPLTPGGTGGYLGFQLSIDGTNRVVRVHQLVAKLFGGYTPDQLKNKWVCHIDQNRYNNHINNLRLMSPADRAKNRNNRGSFKGQTYIIAEKNGERLVFDSQTAAAKALNVSQISIACCLSVNLSNKTVGGWAFSRGEAINTRGRMTRKCKSTNLTTGEIVYWDSQLEAAKELNLRQSDISKCASGKAGRVGNYLFTNI